MAGFEQIWANLDDPNITWFWSKPCHILLLDHVLQPLGGDMVFQTKRYKKYVTSNEYCRSKSKLKGVCTTKNPPYLNATDLNAIVQMEKSLFKMLWNPPARVGAEGVRIDAGVAKSALDGGVAFYAGKMHSGSTKNTIIYSIWCSFWPRSFFCLGILWWCVWYKNCCFSCILGRFWCLGLFERCSKFSCGFHTIIKTLRQILRFAYVSQVLAYDTYVSMIWTYGDLTAKEVCKLDYLDFIEFP